MSDRAAAASIGRLLRASAVVFALGCGQSAPAAPPAAEQPTKEIADKETVQKETPPARPAAGEPRTKTDPAPAPAGRPAETPMNAVDPVARITRFLEEKDLADPASVNVAPGPSPLFDPTATAPFAFYQAMPRGGGPPGRVPSPVCVMVDTRDGTVHHKAPEAFENVARVLDLGRSPDRFSGDEWLTMAYVLRHGEPPTIAFGPTGAADKAVDAQVTAPAVEKRRDGGIVITGWTSRQRGRQLTHHRISYSIDGEVSMSEGNGEGTGK